MTTNIEQTPDIKLSIKQTFGIDSDMEVDAFSKKTDYVPDIDKTYKFDKDTTLAILSGFSFNKRDFSNLNHMNKFKFNSNDLKAFEILGVGVGLKWAKIQEKFKRLVKKFHPDMNAGNKKFEDKLKVITLAYTQLKNTYKDKIDNKY